MRVDRARAGRYFRAGTRWTRLLTSRRRDANLRVFFGHDRIPGPGEPVAGGTAKFQRLSERFPNHPTDFNLLYLGTTWLPRDFRPLLWLARRRRLPVVVNQNGVGWPGWAGARTEEVNRPLRYVLEAADHVLYQSEFCKRSSDKYLGPPRGDWEILPNAVDVERFTPAAKPPPGGPILLLTGDQLFSYRLELALRTLAVLLTEYPGARLLVTGRLVSSADPFLDELDLRGRVDLLGRYAQADAPALYRRAHLLLHPQVNDACPSAVIEAMACGLPVVHSASGGTVELVAEIGGIGVPHGGGWDHIDPPSPQAMAAAAARVLADLPRYREAARERAVAHYSLVDWLDRHEKLFSQLVG